MPAKLTLTINEDGTAHMECTEAGNFSGLPEFCNFHGVYLRIDIGTKEGMPGLVETWGVTPPPRDTPAVGSPAADYAAGTHRRK